MVRLPGVVARILVLIVGASCLAACIPDYKGEIAYGRSASGAIFAVILPCGQSFDVVELRVLTGDQRSQRVGRWRHDDPVDVPSVLSLTDPAQEDGWVVAESWDGAIAPGQTFFLQAGHFVDGRVDPPE